MHTGYRERLHPAEVTMKILVVADDKQLAATVKRALEQEGYAVDIALTGTDGRWLATEQEYDAIVLDVMLPGLNGYRLCAGLRDAGNWTPCRTAHRHRRR